MPTIVKVQKEGGGVGYLRLCWCCRETGVATPTSDPQPSPLAASGAPGKCGDCHLRSLAGLPLGRRLDS